MNSSANDYPPEFETLIGLVRHYSPTGQESEAVSWLVRRMAGLGFTKSYVDDVGNAIGVMGAGESKGVLLGHIDTVPGEIPVRLRMGRSRDAALWMPKGRWPRLSTPWREWERCRVGN